MSDFHKAADHILKVEGGFVNHPDDPGGATKYGITQRTFDRYNTERGDELYRVQFLHKAIAREIYKEHYWDPMRLDRIHTQSMATIIFDQAVNQGIRTVGRRVQSVAHQLGRDAGAVDGIIGPVTIQAVNACRPYAFNREFLIQSQVYYAKLVRDQPKFSVFLVGWSKRMAHLWRMMDQV